MVVREAFCSHVDVQAAAISIVACSRPFNVCSYARIDEFFKLFADRLELFFDASNAFYSNDMASRRVLMTGDSCDCMHSFSY